MKSIFDEIFKLSDSMEFELGSHEQVVFATDKNSGLKAIIAIHNTALGPALGGCRVYPYKSDVDAIRDALRLSKGMTYKAACADLPLGGGKSVIIADPKEKSQELFKAFGDAVERLQGRYITAEDVNTTVKDMGWVREQTSHVVGVSKKFGGSGDPSPVTALGVFSGLQASVEYVTGSRNLTNVKVAVQGVGHVGLHLTKLLVEAGAKVWACDTNKENLEVAKEKYDIKIVSPNDIFKQNVDVFSPCAMGGILNSKTIPLLKAKIVAGAANNQLENEKRHSLMIEKRGIVYCPDYVINAGGLINVYNEIIGYDRKVALSQAKNIYDTIYSLLEISDNESVSTVEAAAHIAEKRIEEKLQPKGNAKKPA